MLDLWLIDTIDNPTGEAAQAMKVLNQMTNGRNAPLGCVVRNDAVIAFRGALHSAKRVDHFHWESLPVVEQVWWLRDACRRLGVIPKVVEVLDVLTAGSDIEWPLTNEQLNVMNPPLAWALDTYGSAVQQLLDCVTLGCLTRPPLED